MRKALAIVTAAAVSVTVHAQKLPRMPWGDPDLQVTWSNATVTPLERPAALGDKAFFTAEEAAEFDRTGIERLLKSVEPGIALSGELNVTWLEVGKGVRSHRTSLVTDPANGQIPYTTEGKRHWDAVPQLTRPMRADSPEERASTERCLGSDAFFIPNRFNDNNHQIVQTKDYIVISTEIMHETRIIPLDGRPHLKSGVTSWSGDPRGHWEGQTLVIETTNFDDRRRFHGATLSLRLVERLTRVDDETIDYELTVSDPGTFTQPWTIVNTLRALHARIYEYACHEHNYGLQGILRGARFQEQGR